MPDEINWDALTRSNNPNGADNARRNRERSAPQEASWWRKAIAPVLAAGATALKFGWPLLKFLPVVLKTGGSMLLSIGAYAWLYGWKFAVGFVVLLFVHEMGHSIAAKACGLKVSAPVFIPFLGAQILLKEMPPNAWVEAIVGYGGPLLGTIGGMAAFVIGVLTGSPLFYALASSAFFLNLFNLVPIIPLDGGRIVTAISPWLWIVGIVLLVPYLLLSLSGAGIYILILVATSLPRVWRQFKNRNDPESQRYYECAPWQRGVVSVAYFGLVLFLAFAMTETHHILAVL